VDKATYHAVLAQLAARPERAIPIRGYGQAMDEETFVITDEQGVERPLPYGWLPGLALSEKDLQKHLVVVRMPFDLYAYVVTGIIVDKPSYLLVLYNQGGRRDGAKPLVYHLER
jgi:hypothetical protein